MVTKGETGKLQLSILRYSAISLLAIGLAWVGVPSEDSGDAGLSSAAAQAAVMPAARDSAVVEEDSGRDVGVYPDPYFMHREPHDDGGYFYYGTACYSSGHVDQIACI